MIVALHLHTAFTRNNCDSIARTHAQATRLRWGRHPGKFSLEETNADWCARKGRGGGDQRWELNKNHANRRFGPHAAGNEMSTELARSLGWFSGSACEWGKRAVRERRAEGTRGKNRGGRVTVPRRRSQVEPRNGTEGRLHLLNWAQTCTTPRIPRLRVRLSPRGYYGLSLRQSHPLDFSSLAHSFLQTSSRS